MLTYRNKSRSESKPYLKASLALLIILFLSAALLGSCAPATQALVSINHTVTPGVADTPEFLIQPTEVEPEFFPPQFMIAFISGESSGSDRDLNIISINGEGFKNLTDTHNLNQSHFPAWSPDGSRIAFVDCLGVSGIPDKRNMLYVISRDGANLTSMERILSTADVTPSCFTVSWSPDGNRFAFQGQSPNSGIWSDIFIVSAEGDSLENLTKDFIYENAGGCQGLQDPRACQQERVLELSPVWSPDGSTLAIIINDEIYIAGDNGDNLRKLTDQPGNPDSINWAPDSKSIVYANGGVIYSVSVDHGDIQGIGRGDAPDLSPDGMHIAFNGQYGDIYVMDIRGKNKIQIAPSDSFSPHWSPDGTFIAFQKFINGKQTIWVVSKDGGWEKELVENEGWNNNEISWSK